MIRNRNAIPIHKLSRSDPPVCHSKILHKQGYAKYYAVKERGSTYFHTLDINLDQTGAAGEGSEVVVQADHTSKRPRNS
jgi:hypothetical protein